MNEIGLMVVVIQDGNIIPTGQVISLKDAAMKLGAKVVDEVFHVFGPEGWDKQNTESSK